MAKTPSKVFITPGRETITLTTRMMIGAGLDLSERSRLETDQKSFKISQIKLVPKEPEAG